MTTAVLVFTFGPVQSFIIEARRASDLFVGSAILSELAKAAAQAIGVNDLVYPASVSSDVPNVLVARVPAANAKSIAEQAEQKLYTRWKEIAESARNKFVKWGFTDPTFDNIWQRQVEHMWEVYWVAAEETTDYAEAYARARAALDAVKRSRIFTACDEPGIKDTLSGLREALHCSGQVGYSAIKEFWQMIAQHPSVGPSLLRSAGRERLDAIGAVKRFCNLADKQFPSVSEASAASTSRQVICNLADKQFPSVSTITALDFIERARQRAPNQLQAHRDAVDELLGEYAYQPRAQDNDWPFDGDLLFAETLTKNRLEDSYALTQPDRDKLDAARRTLKALYKAVGGSPSPYYALLVLDGDSMGRRINECLKQQNSQQAHKQLSQSLANFASQVQNLFQSTPGCLIYNGGDDVLAFLPLAWVLEKAQALSQAFDQVSKNAPVPGTVSAGIALVHHLHPLDAALRAARAAEREAKRVAGKAAVCITALKRSGERVTAATKWNSLGVLQSLIAHLQGGNLSTGFVTDASLSLEAIPDNQTEMLQAELRRQARRHGAEPWVRSGKADQLASQLSDWSAQLPNRVDDLRRWLGIARFIVRESQENNIA
jgi:CRISPR-associated protein Cmr2